MRWSVILTILILFANSAEAVEIQTGDVIVLDPSQDTVVRVRPNDYDAGDPDANQVEITQGDQLANPYDVAIGDGVLFVTDSFNNTIVRVDVETGQQSLVPLQSSIKPRGIAIDSTGMLMVGDQQGFLLAEVDPDTGFVANLSPGIFINTPIYVDLGPDDEVFIIEAGQGLVRLDIDLQLREVVGSGALSGLVVDDTTREIYASGSSEIYRYAPDAYDSQNPTANRTTIFAGDDAADVGLLPGGDLVATNSDNSDLLRIDLDSGVGTRASNGGSLLIPSGLAVVLPEPRAELAIAAAILALAVLASARSRRLDCDGCAQDQPSEQGLSNRSARRRSGLRLQV